MSIKQDSRTELTLDVNHLNNRRDIRAFVINTWLKESKNTKYRYFVEKYDGDKRIYLERPTNLNKGCDFKIFAEDLYLFANGNDRPPSHQIVFDIVKHTKKSNPKQLEEIFSFIKKIHSCENIKKIPDINCNVPENSPITKSKFCSLEIILKLIKWFFIEQDINYWNYTGRDMLFDGANEINNS